MAQIKLDDPVLDSRHAFTRVFLAAEYWKRKYVSLKNLISTSDVQRDAARYRKLRAWMTANVDESWKEVEQLGSIGAWVSWDAFDRSLDALPKCDLGVCAHVPDHLK